MRFSSRSNFFRSSAFALLGPLLGLALGCGRDSTYPTPPVVGNVTVTVNGATPARVSTSVQFAAAVTGSPNQAVTWQVNGFAGGNPTVGTISTTGLYLAPAVLPTPNSVTIKAVSVAVPTASGTADEPIWNPIPVITSAAATFTGTNGAMLIDILGTNFVANAQVSLAGVAQAATLLSPTEIQTTFIPAANVSVVSVAVINPNPGSASSNAVQVQIPQITVTVNGTSPIRLGASTTFAATVTGTANQGVTWQVLGAPATGTITGAGVYTAPATLPSSNPVTIVATSVVAPVAGQFQETIVNCAPTLTSGTATHTGTGGAVLLDVIGTCFVPGTQLSVAGTPQVATYVSPTELQTTFTPASTVTSVAVTATTPNPGSATSNTINIQIPQVVVTVTGTSPVRLGQSMQLSATVTGTSNTGVTWALQGAPATGTLTASGNSATYTAPNTLPAPNPAIITATSVDVTTSVGQFAATVINPVPVIATATATQTCVNGALLIDVIGSNFVNGAQIAINGATQSTSFLSSTELQTTYTPASGVTSVTVTVVNPNPGSATSNGVTVTLTQIGLSVTGQPQTRVGAQAQFTATTTSCTTTGVTWQVNGVTGGTATTGTISITGLFTAPAAVPASNPVTITAISLANSSVTGTLSETILNPVPTITSATATPTCTTNSVLIDVRGTGFVNGSIIQFTGATGSTSFISSTELQTTFTPAAGVTSISVTVLNPAPGSSTSAPITVTIPQIGITVTGPAYTRLGLTNQFAAAVSTCPGSAVTWQVNGVTGGTSFAGTISPTGLFTAPTTLPSSNPVSITATSAVNTAVVSPALLETIGNPVPVILSGTAVQTNSTVLVDLIGTGFVNGAQIFINGVAVLQTNVTFISSTELQATYTPASGVTSISVYVVNPNPVSATSNTIQITIVSITVTVTGPPATRLGLTNQFTATVTGTSNQAVIWQVNGATGGSLITGTISTTGLFTAPTSLPSPNPVTITAVSVAYPTVSGSLSETIWNSVPVITSATSMLTNTPDAVLLDVIGTGFDSGAQIVVAGSSLTTSLISSTEVQATYNPTSSQEHNTYQNTVPVATSISVTVVNPNPGSATSNAVSVALPELYAYTGALPSDEPVSPYFTLSVGGVPIYMHEAEVNILNFASFTSDLNGISYNPNPPYLSEQGYTSFGTIQLVGSSMITIGFRSGYPKAGPITSASQIKILPTGAIDPATIKIVNGTIQFPVTQSGTPQQLTIDVDGDYLNSFNLWINPFDVIPTGGTAMTPGYITTGLIQSTVGPYIFGPGEYIVSGTGYNVTFRASSEIYLADGAIIHRYSAASADGASGPMINLGGNPAAGPINMYMHGSGIVDGNGSQGDSDPSGCGYGTQIMAMVDVTLGPTSKVGVDGITFRNSCAFSTGFSNVIGLPSNHAFYNNVKVLGWRHNSDALDLFSDQYVDVTHSYFRTDDDLIVVDQLGTPPGSHASRNINVTNNILWNELAHAITVGPSYASSETDTDGAHDILFDHDTIIHDTGKASLIGVYTDASGVIRNVTFSNIVAEESRALIVIVTGPGYGVKTNPGIVQNITFSNINQTVHQVTGYCCSGYITPVPNIQLLVQLPYGNPYIGNGTTSGTSPAVIQAPINFNNVTVAGVPVTTATHTQGNYASYPIPAENIIDETVLVRQQNTYGPFNYEPNQVILDIMPPFCNGTPCTLGPVE